MARQRPRVPELRRAGRGAAPGDELTCDLLPEAVLGQKPRRIGRLRPANLDALVSELIQQGIAAAGPQADNLSAQIVNRVEKELILHVLADCDNVQTKAADRLGINAIRCGKNRGVRAGAALTRDLNTAGRSSRDGGTVLRHFHHPSIGTLRARAAYRRQSGRESNLARFEGLGKITVILYDAGVVTGRLYKANR